MKFLIFFCQTRAHIFITSLLEKKNCDRRARQNNVFDSWPRVKTFQLYMPRFGEFNQNLPASYCFGS